MLNDLADFIADHRLHGTMTADATPPAGNGYQISGVTFQRWITPENAELDLLRIAGPN